MEFSGAEYTDPLQICPYLGLAEDRESHFSYPETAHVCFAANRAASIDVEHQTGFCFSQNYGTCSRFVELKVDPSLPSSASAESADKGRRRASFGRTTIWSIIGFLAGLLIIISIYYYGSLTVEPNDSIADTVDRIELKATAGPTIIPTPTASVEQQAAPTTVPVAMLATPTATPRADNLIYTIPANAADIGWLASNEERGNHFGDSYLYAGILEGHIHVGAFQFDLGDIPRGARIYNAVIELNGLRAEKLSRHTDSLDVGGVWALRMLESEIDQNWRRHAYQDIFNAPVAQTLQPLLSSQDLEVGRINTFQLSPAQIRVLETRIIDDKKPTVSFRVEGPLVGPDNLFAWDTGFGPQSQGNKVNLVLEVGPPPATPPPYDYIVVTSTPTPENVVTAAALVLQTTAEATRFGTATPVPPNVVTATPFPEYLVIVPTPMPENTVTAEALLSLATAEALTTGTPTTLPTNAVTATPTPSATFTPTATPLNYVLITATPTPETIFQAATLSAVGTVRAGQIGTPTPLPANWVTPVVVTASPTPINAATAQVLMELATAIALTTGTPTPTPGNVVTATPTPVYELISRLIESIPTPVPTPTPDLLPATLLGKILFLSDREFSGQEVEEDDLPLLPDDLARGSVVYYRDPKTGEIKRVVRNRELVYVFDPVTGELGRLTDSWPFYMALERDTYSADRRFRVFTKDVIRYKNEDINNEVVSVRNDAPALFWHDAEYEVEAQLTEFATGIAYDGAWSPTAEQITFVSNDSGDDEIWVVNRDGSNLRQLTSSNKEYNATHIGKDDFIPELNKNPSWSPDGKQIVFMSNRTGGNQQLWIMNADGSDQRLLMGWDNWTPYNDWRPVWVKSLDPAP